MDYFQFDLIASKTIDLLNRSPMAFKESLSRNGLPFFITTEILIKGYETLTINIIPQIQTVDNEDDPSFNPESSSYYLALRKVIEKWAKKGFEKKK